MNEIQRTGESKAYVGQSIPRLMPTADVMPRIDLFHEHSPSRLNPLGVKGVGEGSAISPPVVIANAVSDALSPFKAEFNSTPVKPKQIVQIAMARGLK